MRLKVLPPTLRKNNRYLTLDIKITSPITKDDFVNIIWDTCIRFQGECNTSNFNLWVMKFYEIEKTDQYIHYKSIIRCQRDFVDEVRSSLALTRKYNGMDISITTIGLSGTIKSSQKFITFCYFKIENFINKYNYKYQLDLWKKRIKNILIHYPLVIKIKICLFMEIWFYFFISCRN